MSNVRKKVLVAMSGGIDSSLSCVLLLERGFEVAGVTMHLAKGEEESDTAIEGAREICRALSIPHYVVDFSREFEELVVEDFVSQYLKGKTPNPCVVCNRRLKFGKLLEYARHKGFDFLATGHYAKIEEKEGKYFLRRPKDRKKDQTYFLYDIGRDNLPYIIFPLSDFTKKEVKELSLKYNLHIAEESESKDICFLPEGDYRKFLEERISLDSPGFIVTTEGKIVGEHKGYFRYTIGQRKGLGVAHSRPLYVVAVHPERNEVVVGEREALEARGLVASHFQWLVDELPSSVFAQVRYLQKEKACSVEIVGPDEIRVIFKERVEMISPGQSVVLYSDDTVLGGGIIEEAF